MTETPNPHIIDADTLTGEMRPIRRVVLALGSNLGGRMENLQGARPGARRHPGRVGHRRSRRSTRPSRSTHRTGSRNFLNAVVLADTTLAANRLMDRALADRGRLRPGALARSRTPRAPSTST